MTGKFDTVVIGAGQAGLAASYHLTQQKREHIVLEKHRIGEAWRSKRWDSFTLVTPNWTLRLPGFAYKGDDPDGFLTRDEVVQYLEDYAALFNPPLRLGVEVFSVDSKNDKDGFTLETNAGVMEASNVIIAAGTFQRPKLPAFSQKISPGVVQIHSSLYRNPETLPPGAVLVVGSAQSGCQIAEELYLTGRKVFLCTSSAGRAPRRYRGKDFAWWANELGILDETVEKLKSQKERFRPNPHTSGKDGGRELNLHQFAADGVTLLGRLKDADGSKVFIAEDLMENLAKADKFAADIIKGVDQLIEKTGMEVPAEDIPELRAGYDSEVITKLNLDAEGIRSIIWGTGFTFDFRWIRFPILDEYAYPIQKRGITGIPGLYFLGLQWLYTIKSGLFAGVGDDAAHVTGHLAGHR